jgi:hypothetical protein
MPLGNEAKRDYATEPPASDCPDLTFPDLTSYVSPKEEEAIFLEMAKALLVYVEMWPEARGARVEGKPTVQTEKTAKEYLYVLKRWLNRTWKEEKVICNVYKAGIMMIAACKNLFAGQVYICVTRTVHSLMLSSACGSMMMILTHSRSHSRTGHVSFYGYTDGTGALFDFSLR